MKNLQLAKDYFLWLKTNLRKIVWTYIAFELLLVMPFVKFLNYLNTPEEKPVPVVEQPLSRKLESCNKFVYDTMKSNTQLIDRNIDLRNRMDQCMAFAHGCRDKLSEILSNPNYREGE